MTRKTIVCTQATSEGTRRLLRSRVEIVTNSSWQYGGDAIVQDYANNGQRMGDRYQSGLAHVHFVELYGVRTVALSWVFVHESTHTLM